MKYAIVIEKGATSFGAYAPDLPGCAAVGESRSEVIGLIKEPVELHLQNFKEHGKDVPPPACSFDFVEVSA